MTAPRPPLASGTGAPTGPTRPTTPNGWTRSPPSAVSAIESLGALPLAVVTAADHPVPGLASAATARLNEVWDDGQEGWLSLSSDAHLVVRRRTPVTTSSSTAPTSSSPRSKVYSREPHTPAPLHRSIEAGQGLPPLRGRGPPTLRPPPRSAMGGGLLRRAAHRRGLFLRRGLVPTTGPGPTGEAPEALLGFTPATLDWTSCGGRLQCASLEVPLDYDDPAGPHDQPGGGHAPGGRPGREDRQCWSPTPAGQGASGIDFLDSDGPFSDDIARQFDLVALGSARRRPDRTARLRRTS